MLFRAYGNGLWRRFAKAWELRATMSLARLWQSQGKRQDAYDLLGFQAATVRKPTVRVRQCYDAPKK